MHKLIPLITTMLFGSFCGGLEADQQTLDFIDSRYEQTASTAQQLWDLAELGYLEEKSSAILQKQLQDEGFRVEAGVADIPTAFVASYGRRGLLITQCTH